MMTVRSVFRELKADFMCVPFENVSPVLNLTLVSHIGHVCVCVCKTERMSLVSVCASECMCVCTCA